MIGQIYAVSRDRRKVAIETEHDGFTIAELVDAADVAIGDQLTWDSDWRMGVHTYRNVDTARTMSVNVLKRFVARSAVFQHL